MDDSLVHLDYSFFAPFKRVNLRYPFGIAHILL
jgi:hypothetical protein